MEVITRRLSLAILWIVLQENEMLKSTFDKYSNNRPARTENVGQINFLSRHILPLT